VLGYDESTATVGSYPISVVHINADPVTGVVVIDGEPVETTPEHPFYTVEAGWLDAEDLVPGLHVPSADGTNGVVEAISWTAGPATMYNLTVEEAHTFFVGEGAWLVHNDGCGPLLMDPGDIRFSQRGISSGFRDKSKGTIDDLARSLKSKDTQPLDVEPISDLWNREADCLDR